MTDQSPPPNAAQVAEINRKAQDLALQVISDTKLRQWAMELAFKCADAPKWTPQAIVALGKDVYEFTKAAWAPK